MKKKKAAKAKKTKKAIKAKKPKSAIKRKPKTAKAKKIKTKIKKQKTPKKALKAKIKKIKKTTKKVKLKKPKTKLKKPKAAKVKKLKLKKPKLKKLKSKKPKAKISIKKFKAKKAEKIKIKKTPETKIEVVKPKEAGKQVKTLVLKTAGTNCEQETVNALKYLGAQVDLLHINALICRKADLLSYQMLVLPGGFSHGDYLGSGKILANKLCYKLQEAVPEFIKQGNLVLGICNGFQVLVKSCLLPGFASAEKKQLLTLAFNDSNNFQCEWVNLKNANKKKCVWSKDIKEIFLPIAHAEGKLVAENKDVLKQLYKNDQVVFKYEKNPNGSIDSIAGICDETGRVLGLMPHPERNSFSYQNPFSTRIDLPFEGAGLKIFRNGIDFIKKNL